MGIPSGSGKNFWGRSASRGIIQKRSGTLGTLWFFHVSINPKANNTKNQTIISTENKSINLPIASADDSCDLK
jgi:hypothetical protein